MVKQFEMVERAGNLSDYKWTAKRLKIERPTPSNLKLIVTDFIDPAIKSLRHAENPLARRWYWSWMGNPFNNFYLRMYFLSHKEHCNMIWEEIEEFRKNKVDGFLQAGINDPDVLQFVEKEMAYGIFLEYVSEIALVLWGVGRSEEYKNALHHLWEPLLLPDLDGCLRLYLENLTRPIPGEGG